MGNGYKLSYTAEEINKMLGDFEKCLPVLIDLDTYGGSSYEDSVSFKIVSLLANGGGQQSGVELGNLFSDLDTDRPIRVRFTPPDSSYLPVTVDGVTTVRVIDHVMYLCFCIPIAHGDALDIAAVFISVTGDIKVSVAKSGALAEVTAYE